MRLTKYFYQFMGHNNPKFIYKKLLHFMRKWAYFPFMLNHILSAPNSKKKPLWFIVRRLNTTSLVPLIYSLFLTFQQKMYTWSCVLLIALHKLMLPPCDNASRMIMTAVILMLISVIIIYYYSVASRLGSCSGIITS